MEKILIFKSQKLLGTAAPAAGRFAAAEIFVPPSGDLLRKRGKLFVVVTLKGPAAFAADEAGKLILDALQAEYYSLLEGTPLPALEKAVSAAHRRLLDLVHGSGLANKEEVDFNLVAAVLWGQIVYLAKLGTAGVYLLRRGRLAEIGTAVEAQISIASGLVDDKDVLILGSSAFRAAFPVERLRKVLGDLEKLIVQEENREDLVALIISLQAEETVAENEIIRFAKWSEETPVPPEKRALRFFRDSLSFLKNYWYRRCHPENFYLNVVPPAERKKRRRWRLFLLLFLLSSVFCASAVFTLYYSQKQRTAKETTLSIARAEQLLVSAGDFLDLNNQKAREILSEALTEAERAVALSGRLRGQDIRQRIEELLVKVNKVQADVKISLIYDLAVQGKGSRPTALFGEEGFLYVADVGTDALYRLDVMAALPKVEQLGVGKINQVKLLAGGDDYLYGLASDGLFRVALPKRTITANLGGNLTGKMVTGLAYYSGNLYLLQAAENNFVKYVPTAGGLGVPSNWLKEKTDLAEAVSLAVDGDVYFLFKDGSIKKFTAGKSVDFKLVNLDKPLSGATFLYTRDNLNELYVLDSGNKRLVLFDKNGFYKRQVPLTDKNFLSPEAIWVDLSGGTLYLLDGTRVLSLK